MTYVALLRGINVGGNARVEMPRLKKAFEDLGCKDVKTYINSGNVIFTDKRTAKSLTKLIETAITKEFGLNVPIVIRDSKNIKALCDKIPDEWTNDDKLRTDVIFLWEDIDKPDILDKVPYKPEIETITYIDGALVWNIGRQNVTRGSVAKLIGTGIYKSMTIRNINTVRKLNTLMN